MRALPIKKTSKMTDRLKDELFLIQESYDNNEILFQEFKERIITHLIAHADVSDIESIVELILQN